MIDIGFFELCIIFIVLLFVVGPEELPNFFYKLGRFVRNIKKMWNMADTQFNQPIKPEVDLKDLVQKHLNQETKPKKGSDDEDK